MRLRFLDVCAGIGGFRMGMEQAGHVCAGYAEIDKHARRSYRAIYDTAGEWTAKDIRSLPDSRIRDVGTVQCICAGFPCQPFSIAGRRAGFEDIRGTLFFEIMRFAKLLQPQILFFENVRNLLSHGGGGGETFRTILTVLDDLGYDAEWQVLNSSHFGVPQNRERVYIVGHLRESHTGEVFPIQKSGQQDDSLRVNPAPQIIQAGKLEGVYESLGRIYSIEGIAPTLDTCQGGGRQVKILLPGDAPSFRYLTPKEYWRLQGFPDWAFERVRPFTSDTQLYKQAGNSVSVPVIEAIAKKLADLEISA